MKRISQLFEGVQKYRYVGDNTGFRAAEKPMLITGIFNSGAITKPNAPLLRSLCRLCRAYLK